MLFFYSPPPFSSHFFGLEKSIAVNPFDGGGAHMISRPASSTYLYGGKNEKNTHFGHFALSNTKKKSEAAHFLDARGNEKQVSNLEWPYVQQF